MHPKQEGRRGSASHTGRNSIGRFLVAFLVCLGLVLVTYNLMPTSKRHESSLYSPSFEGVIATKRCTATKPCFFKMVADLDLGSKMETDDGKLRFKSLLLGGSIYKTSESQTRFDIDFDESPVEIYAAINEAGRGMELSELAHYNGRLLAFDDRTGVVFEILKDMSVVPRHIIMEGDGQTTKGMKIEWASEKDGRLYIGSFGKEFTNSDGEIVNEHNNWVAILGPNGEIVHEDWKEYYHLMRKAVGAQYPGYMIHEAIHWSDRHRKWIVLPRRVSTEPYDEIADETRGSNTMLICSPDFTSIRVVTVGEIIPERGFASLKFVPGTWDVILALKSAENSATGEQVTYVMVFNLDGEVLVEETRIPVDGKFEGVEFVS